MAEQQVLGIENLKKAALLAIQFGTQAEESAVGGFQVSDLFAFIDEVAQIPAVIQSKDAILAEFKALDRTKRQELVTYIETTLVLKNKRTEEIIEAALVFVLALLSLVEKFKKVPPVTGPTV